MRSLQIQVRQDHVGRVLDVVAEHGIDSAIALPGTSREAGPDGRDRPCLVILTAPNDAVGRLVSAVHQAVDSARFTLLPRGVLPLQPPLDSLYEATGDVSRLSTIELTIASLQSIGAWTGLVTFSVLAGFISAYGLVFEVSYLLVAAMLINPMGAPALVAVVGITTGDTHLFARGAVRFIGSLLLQALTALVLGAVYRPAMATSVMEQVSSLSFLSVVLALAAGAAGARTQVKSDRDSLVSGTAAGFMVAAALAPPAGVLGLAVTLGRGDLVALMGFVLAMQFLAIGVGGALALMSAGVRPAEPSMGRGSRRGRSILFSGTALMTALLVGWQMLLAPRFVKADASRRALSAVQEIAAVQDGLTVLDVSSRFVNPGDGREQLLIEITARAGPGVEAGAARSGLGNALEQRIRELIEGVTPNVLINVLPPAEPRRAGSEDPSRM